MSREEALDILGLEPTASAQEIADAHRRLGERLDPHLGGDPLPEHEDQRGQGRSPGVPRLIQAHRKIVDAVGRHDKEGSRLWMLRHANDWRRGFERAGNDIDQPIDRVYMKDVMAR
jgi:DNA-binding GntR family transcriptional regulator